MNITVTAGLDMMGADFYATVEINVTSWGCPAKTYGDPYDCYPAEAPEFEVEEIILQHDEPGALGAEWKIDPQSALFDVLCDLPSIRDACYEAVGVEGNERKWMQRMNRRRRSF